MWGDLIEDFLDPFGVTVESLAREGSGGWLFGYIEALRLAGVSAALFCVSARVSVITRYTHEASQSPICVFPATGLYRRIRRRLLNPYAWGIDEAFDRVSWLERPHLNFVKAVAPYLSTPLSNVAEEMRRQSCSAILCQEYESPRFDVLCAFGRWCGYPVFASFQGGDFQVTWLERVVRPFSIRTSAGLIAGPSSEMARLMARYKIPQSKIGQIFNPIDLGLWWPLDKAASREAVGLVPDAEVVVNHGRTLIQRKGLDVLLEAWRILTGSRPGRKLRLLLVGTGRDADILENRIKAMALEGVIRVNEFVMDRGRMRQYLSSADVYVLPSRHEGFPVAPLEAMACGLPVVAARAQGVPEILEGGEASGGLTVPVGDADALAEALGTLLDNPARAQAMGCAARTRVETAFSLEAVGCQLRDFIFWEQKG